MYTDGKTLEELAPIINLAQAPENDTDDGYDSQDSAASDTM